MKASVILPAAGLGTRMARPSGDKLQASRKQFLMLDGAPIVFHTIRKFAGHPSVAEVIVALRPEDQEWRPEIEALGGGGCPVRVVEGGESRQQSVENGLSALSPETELVAVHDAVRPFVDPGTIEAVIREAAATGAAIVGIVPVDTVKQVHLNRVRQTIPRERLVLAQTPQVFSYALLKEAFRRASQDGFIGTDEASLVERLETVEVSVVPGSDRNIKITKPSDMDLARLFLERERAAAGVATTDAAAD